MPKPAPSPDSSVEFMMRSTPTYKSLGLENDWILHQQKLREKMEEMRKERRLEAQKERRIAIAKRRADDIAAKERKRKF